MYYSSQVLLVALRQESCCLIVPITHIWVAGRVVLGPGIDVSGLMFINNFCHNINLSKKDVLCSKTQAM